MGWVLLTWEDNVDCERAVEGRCSCYQSPGWRRGSHCSCRRHLRTAIKYEEFKLLSKFTLRLAKNKARKADLVRLLGRGPLALVGSIAVDRRLGWLMLREGWKIISTEIAQNQKL